MTLLIPRLGYQIGGRQAGLTFYQHCSDLTLYKSAYTMIYGGKAFDAGPCKVNLTMGGAYTWHDIKSRRTADAAGENETLKATTAPARPRSSRSWAMRCS